MKSEPFDGKSPAMKKDTPWLSAEDLLDAGEVAVEIEGVWKHTDAVFDDARKETVHALQFKGKQRQLILNATNRKTLVAKFGTTDVKKWIGQSITLYVQKDVRKPGGKRGETTCGIRVR
jgi:hypothetical protein